MSEEKLFFIKLGHNRNLSKLELSSILENLKELNKVSYFEFKSFLFFYLPSGFEEEILTVLPYTGSIVKFGYVITIGKVNREIIEIKDTLNSEIEQLILERYKSISPPLKIAIHVNSKNNTETEQLSLLAKDLLHQIARERRLNLNIRRPKKVSFELSPAQYFREKFPKRGLEIGIFKIKSKVYLTHTVWVTNPNIDILLDEKRPARFFTHGTSIKVARSMVFLSKTKSGDLIVDPFCGTGTILIMALLKNCNAIGVDTDQECVKASQKNLTTLIKEGLINSQYSWSVFSGDVRRLSEVISKEVSAIVTEPYLGPFLKRLPRYERGTEIMKELEELYIEAFAEFNHVIKKGGRVVFIIPEYNYRNKQSLSPNINKILEETSFKLIEKSRFFNVTLPIKIGRKHNIISRKLIIVERV